MDPVQVLGTSKHGYQGTAKLEARLSIGFPHMSCLLGRDGTKHNTKKHSSYVYYLWKDLSLLRLVRMVNLGLRLELIGPKNVAAAEELLKV